MGRGVVSDRQHDRRAGLWTAGGFVRPAADDLHGARAVHGRLGAVRAVAQHRIPDGRARIARPWRRRPDDAIASAGRRDDSAARARALSGLSGGRVGSVEHIRPGRRRISHAGLRLAIDFSGQCAARPCRRGDGAAAQDQTRRLAQNEFRCARVGAVHVVRQPGHPGARAGATHGRRHAAADRGPARVRSARAAGADLAGEAFNLAAHSASSIPRAFGLARRCHDRLSWRRVGVVDHVPADLPARGPRRGARARRAC